MTTRYEINGAWKHWEEDRWGEGCIPGTGGSFDINIQFVGKTPEEVIERAKAQFGDYDVILNSCDEPGRVDIRQYEDDEGNAAFPSDLEAWKRGEMRLWLVEYTMQIEKVTREDAPIGNGTTTYT